MEKEEAEITGFNEEIINIQAAIAGFESGHKLNIAITAEPLAGRTMLINEVEKINYQKVTRLSFSSTVKNKGEISLPEQLRRIVLIDDCQFLYTRRIGGFHILEDFLELMTSSNNIFITAWNLYSWKYLEKVVNIGKYFPVQIKLPKFSTSEIKECILSRYKPNEIKFIENEYEKEKIIEIIRHPAVIKPLKKPIDIPFFKINYDTLKLRLFKKEKNISVEDVVFEKIARISNGNPGVAKIIWQNSLEYPVIKPGKIKEFSFNIELDYNESFILGVILSMGTIKKKELSEIAGYDYGIDETLFRLLERGLISIEEDHCSIKPEALRSIVEFLKRSRLVW
ncbi:hypothetical protein METP2_00661 [Methanosarcinales archaeon]|nr:hypothetical protein [Candidatus Methanoperedens sp.]CAG0958763.1 hypothetical protein METP2_00661 [Methanosarcinales archaeon]